MSSIHLRDWTTSKWSTTTPTSSNLRTFSGKSGWGFNTYIKSSVLEASDYLKDDTLLIKCTLWVKCASH
ncbi:MATH domain-containing protein [Carex littledalei]|uniref:MATH domain-containing protein n=1 Tax=Carex littledalei TaxID=544730 RepID=A0A833RIS6_9POAL|nr:MATH domain-containing protein [Carex littledalei]